MKGKIINDLMDSDYLRPGFPCYYIGFNESIISLYNLIIEKTRLEKSGYQPYISGIVLHFLGLCHSIIKQSAVANKAEEIIMDRARLLFRSNINSSYSPEKAAEGLNVGYSSFRKLFKSYTGLSPGQYYLQLKIEKAKELLRNSNRHVKEISIELNFESSYYFSKIFKDKTGMNPTEFLNRASPVQNINLPGDKSWFSTLV